MFWRSSDDRVRNVPIRLLGCLVVTDTGLSGTMVGEQEGEEEMEERGGARRRGEGRGGEGV